MLFKLSTLSELAYSRLWRINCTSPDICLWVLLVNWTLIVLFLGSYIVSQRPHFGPCSWWDLHCNIHRTQWSSLYSSLFSRRERSDIFLSFYFEAAKTLDRLDAKRGSIKGVLATLPEKDRRRTAALVIETLKCEQFFLYTVSWPQGLRWSDKSVLNDIISASELLSQERKLSSHNLALVLVHDMLFTRGIQAGDGPLKQAVLRHRTRLHSELQRIKIKRGARSNDELADIGDTRAGRLPVASPRQVYWTPLAQIPRYIRVNTLIWSTKEAIQAYISRCFEVSKPVDSVWVIIGMLIIPLADRDRLA